MTRKQTEAEKMANRNALARSKANAESARKAQTAKAPKKSPGK
jgi:hypothetical protein